MSLRYEQHRALKMTREFLHEIITSKEPLRKKALREKAYSCLKHFPLLNEKGKPIFSEDNFGD